MNVVRCKSFALHSWNYGWIEKQTIVKSDKESKGVIWCPFCYKLQCCNVVTDSVCFFLGAIGWSSVKVWTRRVGRSFLMVRRIRADNQFHFIVYQICLLYATSCMSWVICSTSAAAHGNPSIISLVPLFILFCPFLTSFYLYTITTNPSSSLYHYVERSSCQFHL